MGCTAMLAAVLAVGCVAVAAGIVAAARSGAASLVVAADMAAAADTAVVEHHAAHCPAVDWAAMTAETQEAWRITGMFPSMAKLFVSRYGTAVHIVLIRSLVGDVARS